MKIAKLLLLGIMACLLSCKCGNLFEDMEFNLKRIEFKGSQFKLDGYYYQKYGDPEQLTIYFFYENGIVLHAGDGYSFEIEKKFHEDQLYKKLRENKYCWGIFQIDTTSIKFERYYNSDNPSKEAYVSLGTILNDTTFIITRSIRSDGKFESEKNETYHFKQFSPKPDSTNNFIQ